MLADKFVDLFSSLCELVSCSVLISPRCLEFNVDEDFASEELEDLGKSRDFLVVTDWKGLQFFISPVVNILLW